MTILVGLVLIAVAVGIVARMYAGGTHPRRATVGAPQPAPTEVSPEPDEPQAPSLKPWSARDIDPDTALQWIERGFDADHAYLLMSMAVEPRTAARLRDAGLDDDAVVALVEEAAFGGITSADDLVSMAEKAPDLAPQFVDWTAAGTDADRALRFAEAGLSPSSAALWTDAGWDLDDAVPWCRARFEPATARAWHDRGFGAEEARLWRSEHFGVKQATDWRKLGDTPARARAVEQRLAAARITVADGLEWLERGFSIDEICAGRAEMATRGDASR